MGSAPQNDHMTWSWPAISPLIVAKRQSLCVCGWKRWTRLHMVDITCQLLQRFFGGFFFSLSMLPLQQFQLHGPQTHPLIFSRFLVKVCHFVPSSCTFRLGHLHQQLQRNLVTHSPCHYFKKTGIQLFFPFFSFFYGLSGFSFSTTNKLKTTVPPVKFLIENNTPCRTAFFSLVDQITWLNISLLRYAESSLDEAQK